MLNTFLKCMINVLLCFNNVCYYVFYNDIFITILFNPLGLRRFGPEEVLTIVFFPYLKTY